MVGDLPELKGIKDEKRDPSLIVQLLREKGLEYVTYQDWQVLNEHEVGLGKEQNRPRVKCTRVEEMMEIIKKGATSKV